MSSYEGKVKITKAEIWIRLLSSLSAKRIGKWSNRDFFLFENLAIISLRNLILEIKFIEDELSRHVAISRIP